MLQEAQWMPYLGDRILVVRMVQARPEGRVALDHVVHQPKLGDSL